MASPCIGFEIGLGHICWYFRAYICSKILKVLHPCIGFGIGLGHIWGHANAWIWYIHAYAWILYIHVLSHISHIPKAEIFGFMFQYLSSERMGLRFWANPIHNTWLDHGEISRTRCTPNRPAVFNYLIYVVSAPPPRRFSALPCPACLVKKRIDKDKNKNTAQKHSPSWKN